jgi:CxxC motif-containing protein (DUF1111 family)
LTLNIKFISRPRVIYGSTRSLVDMTRSPLILLLFVAACGSDPEVDPLQGLTIVGEDPSDVPFADLEPEWQDRFVAGDALFETVFRDGQGLGPVYIRQSCASCHADDARGPGAVRKMIVVDDDGVTPLEDQSALPYGHTVRPQVAAGATLGITAPDAASLLVTVRFGPAVYGRGYLDAIADDEIERVEAAQRDADSEVSGRINRVPYQSEPNPDTRFHQHSSADTALIGRFGLKARIASIDEFAADAYQGDMGITSPLRPDELPNPAGDSDELPGLDIDEETVNLVADYMRLLRIPTRSAAASSTRGSELFADTGCASCHVPSLRTRADYPIAQLADVEAPVYSDVLLHDMGPAFDDGLQEHAASSSEWKTAPLIGLRHLRNYLHDGRAATVEEAIEQHGAQGSEARPSVQRFLALDAAARDELLAFVSAL